MIKYILNSRSQSSLILFSRLILSRRSFVRRKSIVTIAVVTLTITIVNPLSHSNGAEQVNTCREPPVSLVRDAKSLQFEHCLRILRLKRIASAHLTQQPRIEELTAQSSTEVFFEHDVPVLRMWWPDSTFFDVGDDQIRTDALPIIQFVVDVIRQDISQVYTYVIGHTDSTGDSRMNDSLALRRAK